MIQVSTFIQKKHWTLDEIYVTSYTGAMLIPFSGSLEFKIVDMPDDEKAAYLKEVGATR